MNINRLVFTIEDVMNTCSRFAVSADFVDYCDIRTVIGLDKQDLELRPRLEAPYIGVTIRAISFLYSKYPGHYVKCRKQPQTIIRMRLKE